MSKTEDKDEDDGSLLTVTVLPETETREDEMDWLTYVVGYVKELAENMSKEKEERLNTMMREANVVNRSKKSYRGFAISRLERIPYDYKDDWKSVSARNAAFPKKELAFIYLWTTHAYHLIRAIDSPEFNAMMVKAIRKCPKFRGKGYRGRTKATHNSSLWSWISYSSSRKVAKHETSVEFDYHTSLEIAGT